MTSLYYNTSTASMLMHANIIVCMFGAFSTATLLSSFLYTSAAPHLGASVVV
jgi:hypothetical protein